jgi:hypothetical protein
MGARIAAAAVLSVIGILLVGFGVGFLSYALFTALTGALGTAGAAAVTGAVFVGPPVLWAGITLLLASRPRPRPATVIPQNGLWTALFAAIAKETPWIAIVGTGLVGAVELFLSSRKRR